MYAIVEVQGKQYRVEKDLTINVDSIPEAEGAITLDKVLLCASDGNVMVGSPYLENVTVKAEVVGDVKGKKTRGIKFKKRKNYTRTLGHRTHFSQLKINDVIVS